MWGYVLIFPPLLCTLSYHCCFELLFYLCHDYYGKMKDPCAEAVIQKFHYCGIMAG